MTRDEIFKHYEEALEQANERYQKELNSAKEWGLKKLKEIREEK